MSELEKILNDDLLKCEIVKTAENAARRVDLIKWTHDGTFAIAEVRKDTGKIDVIDTFLQQISLLRASVSTENVAISP